MQRYEGTSERAYTDLARGKQLYGDVLSDDDIRAVLAYIRSTWPEDIRKQQAEVSHQETR